MSTILSENKKQLAARTTSLTLFILKDQKNFIFRAKKEDQSHKPKLNVAIYFSFQTRFII